MPLFPQSSRTDESQSILLEIRAVVAPSGEGNSSEKDNFLKWDGLHTVIWQMKTTYILGLCIIPEFRFQILF